MTVDLSAQPVFGGIIRTSRSASTKSEDYQWPDGHITRIKKFTETTVTIERAGMTCEIYTRGSDEHTEMLESVQDYNDAVEEAKRQAVIDAKVILDKRLKEAGKKVGAEVVKKQDMTDIEEVEAGDSTDTGNARDELPTTETTWCKRSSPHYDCIMCSTPTGERKHTTSPAGLQSHYSSKSHKDMASALGELQKV